MWMGEQQQLKKLDKKRNFSIILEKAKKFFTSLPFCFFGRKEGAIMSSIKRLCMLETNEFLSYQPYLELNNNYQSYVPIEHNIIRDIVWEVYEVDDFDLGKTVALPDVCADIMTFYTDDNAYSFFMGGSISLQQMNELDFMKDVKSIFGVRLRTGMLGNLFRCDVKDI